MSDLSLLETIFEIIDTCDIKILAGYGENTAKRCEHKLEAARKALRAVAGAVAAGGSCRSRQVMNLPMRRGYE